MGRHAGIDPSGPVNQHAPEPTSATPAPTLFMIRKPTAFHQPAPTTPWRWAIFGAVLGLAVALLVFPPSAWLAAALDKLTSAQVQLIESRGTVWTGSARLLLTGGPVSRDRALLPEYVSWKIRPGWLAVNVEMTADCCTARPIQAQLTPNLGGATLQVSDGALQWPAAVMAGLGAPWNTVQAQGSLRLATRGLTVAWSDGKMALSGGAELTATGLSTSLSTLKPMGSYRLLVTGGTTPELALSTLEGRLQLSGNGQWANSQLRFRGEASAAPEDEVVFSNLLNIIGRRNGARSFITLG